MENLFNIDKLNHLTQNELDEIRLEMSQCSDNEKCQDLIKKLNKLFDLVNNYIAEK